MAIGVSIVVVIVVGVYTYGVRFCVARFELQAFPTASDRGASNCSGLHVFFMSVLAKTIFLIAEICSPNRKNVMWLCLEN